MKCANSLVVMLVAWGWVVGWAKGAMDAGAILKDPVQREKIEKALPAKAIVQPAKARKLLIFDLNVNYGGHPSMYYAEAAFELMGAKTGAFTTVVSRDPAVFKRESLRRFDAVFFNNNVGNCFTDPELRRDLMEYVTGGGGIMGVHGTTVAFTQWPGAVEDWAEFGVMIGARGANHKKSDELVVVKFDDPGHPLNAALLPAFEYRDEFFRYQDVYSRNRVRVLFSIDTAKTDMKQEPSYGNLVRKDNDYALAWVRNYGRGRVFHCTIGHNPSVFWDAKMLQFYLGAIQFVVGDLPCPTIPSAKLTAAVRAQERLGWRLGVEAYTFHRFTFFEGIEKTAAMGVPFVGGLSFQKVSKEIDKFFTPDLSDDELRQVRMKLDEAGVRLLTYYIDKVPGDEAGCRKVFEFGRKMGIETFMTEPELGALDTIEKMCDEYGINVGLHNHDEKASPTYWSPEAILKVCEGRSKRIGACADIGYWMRGGIDPIEGVRKLGERLITVQMHDLNEISKDGHDVVWGTGKGRTEEFLKEMKRLGLKPTMFGLEYSYDFDKSGPAVKQSAEFFDGVSVRLAE